MADLARIKRNVAKMAAQNAPEEDIDGYIASEGVSLDDVRAFKVSPPPESPQAQALRSEFSGMTQNPKVQWSPSSEANALETALPPSTFRDATESGGTNAIPFADEAYSAVVGAPIRAAKDWMQGEGFDYGRSYDREQALGAEMQRRREERTPVGTVVGNVAGSVAAASPLMKAGISFLQGAKPTLTSMFSRGAAEGGSYGLVYGAGEGSGLEERANNAYEQARLGGALGGGFGALGRIGATKASTAGLPTGADLKTAATEAYKRADDAGVTYSKSAVQRVAEALTKRFDELGFDPDLDVQGAKAAIGKIRKLADAEDGASFSAIDTARKVASNGFEPGKKFNNKLIGETVRALDDLVTNPKAGDVLAGNADEAAVAIKEGRKLYSQSAKLETVERLMEKSGRRAARTGSGANIENVSRQELSKVLDSDRLKRGFTPDELDAINRAVMGTKGQNLLRSVGKFAPTGVVSGGVGATTGATLGGWMGGPAGAAIGSVGLPIVGALAKAASDAGQRNASKIVEAIIRNGGKALPKAQLTDKRKAIVELLMRSGLGMAPSGAPSLP